MKKFKSIMFLIIVLATSFTTANSQNNEWLRPPANLVGPSLVDQPIVNLEWWNPGTPIWRFYGEGNVTGLINFKSGNYELATKYESSDFAPYHGMSIKTFSFVGDVVAHPYTVKIWSGEAGDILEYEQLTDTVNTDAWTDVQLSTPFVIDSTQTYYIGLSFELENEGLGVGIDDGPAVEGGKGNLIRNSEGVFVSLTDFDIDRNLGFAIYLDLDEPLAKRTINIEEDKNTEFSTGVLSVVDFSEGIKLEPSIDKSKAASSFNIYRNNEKVGSSTESKYTDELAEGGEYTYAVTAVYSGDLESEKSKSIHVLYDNNRIPYNTVITETFINIGTYEGLDGKPILNSPSSPGAFKGIYELNYQVDNIAPIVYHSGTAILGADPFSTIASEERFMYYFMATLSYPMTLFNARLLMGGGSSESLYEAYKPLYDQALTMLTPLSFESSLEKKSNSIYTVNAKVKKVGMYSDPNTVLHVVLTQEKIEYDWGLGEFSHVSFVAEGMFPDFEGTPLNFVGDSVATLSVDVTIDPFADVSNYKIIAFVQSVDGFSILNGDMLSIPAKKNVKFTVKDAENQFIENATVTIGENNNTTDAEGVAYLGLWNDAGEVSYTISKGGYFAIDGTFNIDTTSVIDVTLMATDINDLLEVQASIYPNPTTNFVNIHAARDAKVSVYNSLGILVFESLQQENIQTIDLSEFESGVYMVSIDSQSSSKAFRLVKTN